MKQIIFFLTILIMAWAHSGYAQPNYSISGKVTNQKNEPLAGATIVLHELAKAKMADKNGDFIFNDIPQGQYHLHISFLGYRCVHHNTITIKNKNFHKEFRMISEENTLSEVVVEGNSIKQRKKETTTSIAIVGEDFIKNNMNSSLMKSLESLPGISSMEVGQGFSKPVIRGLSFNRVAVTENGIKQEGQQWGADHGLEIDQFGIENIEIIKGPASLVYGSDAIGGVVQVMPNTVPEKNSTQNEVQLIGKSLNDLYGLSAMSKYRKEHWHYYARYTKMNFADYKVPADSFFYNRFRFPIENKTLKNTAGTEQDFYFTTGLIKQKYKSSITFSNVFSKVGFFPGSHGVPDANQLIDDGNNRNIDLPYQQVNHFKLMNNTKIKLTGGSLEVNLGFQENLRQEWSEFHTHYPSQQAPAENPNLEIEFQLQTLSGDVKYSRVTERSTFSAGFSTQHQQNKISGYMFLLPEYTRLSSGVFLYNKYNISSNFIVTGGLRFDYGQTDIFPYYSEYAERYKSPDFTAYFYDFSWALGLSYMLTDKLNLKTNIGKSFRMPNASELSANGIHHGSFRYEVGDTGIVSEYSYQVDVGVFFQSEKVHLELNPFVNYFPNFIFLSPTGSYLHPLGYEIKEADAGQVYQYVQSRAFRAGIDFAARYSVTPYFTLSGSGEYVYATDLKYPIPFTPPLAVFSEVIYRFPKFSDNLKNISLHLNYNFSAAQNRNARNELQTPAYHLFGASVSTTLKIGKQSVEMAFQVQNLFDNAYFNHLSFYRLIELPEAGRNYQLLVKMPFNKTFSK